MDNPLNFYKLKKYLAETLYWDPEKIEITQIAGGYSNLTFLVQTPLGKFAMRRAPFGDKISKAHDMFRESQVLEALQKAGYKKSPKPIVLYEDEDINGSPLLVMEWIDGIVLGNKINKDVILTADEFQKLSQNAIDSLIELHLLELKTSGLINLGKPEGYVERQVIGWTDRYYKSKTNELPEMEKVSDWLKANIPSRENVGFIHNDYKYDNLVLEKINRSEIKSVLDWEMATVGDPLMDLGTTLAYWAQADDPDILKLFNMSHLPGNMTRAEVIQYYDLRTPFDLANILFYYVFGLFKVGVIAQQIYKRYIQGIANDPRFANLIHVVDAAGKMAEKSILQEKI
ncbi:phosphotransferase family protein [Algoriphagus litoralis]|uniref:phosphotransferase family protein n=1 Tax=Algoriphagus litoralis TaxID=2202829 RepID=UPI000DB97C68|nr:phosphotransferase family protein [Algoriphagus litoralis]